MGGGEGGDVNINFVIAIILILIGLGLFLLVKKKTIQNEDIYIIAGICEILGFLFVICTLININQKFSGEKIEATATVSTQINEEFSHIDCEMKSICVKINGLYELPCLFEPDEEINNSFTAIAKEIYGNEQSAGRIAELYRDEEGLIMPILTSKNMIVPDLDIPRTLAYFSCYFEEVMQVGITQCTEINLRFPCFLEAEENETYSSLADKYYPLNNESIIKRIRIANDTEYFFNEEKGWPDLQPISKLTKGTIVILPTTP